MSYFKVNNVEWEFVKNPYKVKKIEYLFKNLKDKKYLEWYVVAESYYGIGDVLISDTPNGYPKYQLLHDDIKDIIPVKQTKTMSKLRDLKESYEVLFESAIKEIDDIRNIFNNKNVTVSYRVFKKYIKHLNKNFEESNLKEIYNYLKESSLDRSTPMTVAASLRNSRTVSGNKIMIGNEFYNRSKNMNILYDLKTGIVEMPILGNKVNLHQLKLLINKFYNFKADDSYVTFEEFIGKNSVN